VEAGAFTDECSRLSADFRYWFRDRAAGTQVRFVATSPGAGIVVELSDAIAHRPEVGTMSVRVVRGERCLSRRYRIGLTECLQPAGVRAVDENALC